MKTVLIILCSGLCSVT